VIKNVTLCPAITPALMQSMANEEIAGTVVYRAAAPVGARLKGTTLPIGAPALTGISVPAGFHWSGVAQIQVDRTAVVDRNRPASVPGAAPRGRPV
jgi:hypothetical protein